MTQVSVAAVDLGASSGRVLVGEVGDGRLELREVNRFANVPVRVAGVLQWDILALYRGVIEGLRAAAFGADGTSPRGDYRIPRSGLERFLAILRRHISSGFISDGAVVGLDGARSISRDDSRRCVDRHASKCC